MEGLGSPPTLLGNLFHTIPLVLEVDGFSIPVVNFIWNGVEGHDSLHEWGGDSDSKEADEDIMVCDASADDVTLESGNVTFQGWGGLSVFFSHLLGREPGDGVPGSVLVFESCLELLKEVVPGSKGDGCTNDCFFLEGICPSQS